MTNAANLFMMKAVCEFGDPDKDKIEAVQAVLDAAGFDARATCWPVFGGIWPKPCEGPEGAEATAWLQALTDGLQRGEYNSEVRQVEAAIASRNDHPESGGDAK